MENLITRRIPLRYQSIIISQPNDRGRLSEKWLSCGRGGGALCQVMPHYYPCHSHFLSTLSGTLTGGPSSGSINWNFWAKNLWSWANISHKSDHDLWQLLDKYLETIRNTVGMCRGDFNWFADPYLSHFCLHSVVTAASTLVIIVIMCDGENKSW